MVFQKILFLQNLREIIYFTSEAISESHLFCKINQSLGFVEKDASLALSQSHELASFHLCLCFLYNLITNIFKYRGGNSGYFVLSCFIICRFFWSSTSCFLLYRLQKKLFHSTLTGLLHIKHLDVHRWDMVMLKWQVYVKKKQDHSRHLEGHIINLVIIAFFDVRV